MKSGNAPKQRGVYLLFKRTLDIIVSFVGLVIFFPIFILTALVIVATMGPPVLFRQTRAGLNRKAITILKFRTMSNEVDGFGNLLPDHARLGKIGSLVRSLSLDELPQLWNVIRGDISLVGPRPLLLRYLGRYTPEQARRHDVLPGITGWAQINGRNDLTWEEKFTLDLWYVDNCTLLLDSKILLLTVIHVLTRRGISQSGNATAEEFFGTFHEK